MISCYRIKGVGQPLKAMVKHGHAYYTNPKVQIVYAHAKYLPG